MSAILVLNAGSSSTKFALFDRMAGELRLLFRGQAETGGAFAVEDAEGRNVSSTASQSDDAAEAIVAWTRVRELDIEAVGHRVVHGGEAFSDAVRLTDAVVEQLHGLTPLAPLHQPACLAPISTVAKTFPGTPQFAAFDTAFHRTIPDAARRYALPREFEADGIRRYGFHGLSYAHVASCLPRILPGCRKVVAAHLGSGASLCAMLDGRSVDTTMGFSALDGLVMATRPGLLDPGILLYLLKTGMDAEAIEDTLYHRSGLLGVSGLSGDLRELEESRDPRAWEAIELFASRIARETAAMANSLSGLDALVFTGGIGEHNATVRRLVGERLAWLGVAIDPAANVRGDTTIHLEGSAVAVSVLPADEERAIAGDVVRLL